MDTWIEFFAAFFSSIDEARAFVEPLESLDVEDRKHPAKIMMHQTKRLISIADDLPIIRAGQESLQLLFLLICAENIAKMHDNFDDDGQSKAYVVKFFNQFVVGDDKKTLESSFATHAIKSLTLEEIAKTLYSVRCDVVHEGRYWGFHFHNGKYPILNTEPDVNVYITLNVFRRIIGRGCIRAIQTYSGRT